MIPVVLSSIAVALGVYAVVLSWKNWRASVRLVKELEEKWGNNGRIL